METKDKMVFVRVSQSERDLFHELGRRLNRSYSDAVRVLVCEAVNILREKEVQSVSSNPPVNAA